MARDHHGGTDLAMQALGGLTGYHLRRASRAIQDDLARTLKPFGLRMITFSALSVIVENAGVSQSRLARALNVEKPNMVRIIDELLSAGWIRRDQVPQDKRLYALKATQQGKACFKEAYIAVRAHEERLLGNVAPESLAAVWRVAQAVANDRGEKDGK